AIDFAKGVADFVCDGNELFQPRTGFRAFASVVVEITFAWKLRWRVGRGCYRREGGAVIRTEVGQVCADVVNIFGEERALPLEPLFVLEKEWCTYNKRTEDQRTSVIEYDGDRGERFDWRLICVSEQTEKCFNIELQRRGSLVRGGVEGNTKPIAQFARAHFA